VDAEIIDDLLPAEIKPTAVLMNSLFSSTGGRVAQHKALYGSRHVASALRRLQEGGRLVAIVGEAMSFHHPNFSEWWQRISCLCNVRANLTLNGSEMQNTERPPTFRSLSLIRLAQPQARTGKRNSRAFVGEKPRRLRTLGKHSRAWLSLHRTMIQTRTRTSQSRAKICLSLTDQRNSRAASRILPS
jgi:hypothetical protein